MRTRSCSARPSFWAFVPAAPFFFDCASAWKPFSCSSRASLAHVRAEARDVVTQVCGEVRRVGEQLIEVVAGRVVEGEAGRSPQLRVKVLEPFASKFRLPLEDLLLRAGEHAIEPSQNGQRQDDVLGTCRA